MVGGREGGGEGGREEGREGGKERGREGREKGKRGRRKEVTVFCNIVQLQQIFNSNYIAHISFKF